MEDLEVLEDVDDLEVLDCLVRIRTAASRSSSLSRSSTSS